MTERIDVEGLPSRTLVAGRDRAHARAMLRAVGLTDEDFEKPLIGIANTWAETTPCNYNLRELAEAVKVGIREAGGTPLEFNTVVVSDGTTTRTASGTVTGGSWSVTFSGGSSLDALQDGVLEERGALGQRRPLDEVPRASDGELQRRAGAVGGRTSGRIGAGRPLRGLENSGRPLDSRTRMPRRCAE